MEWSPLSLCLRNSHVTSLFWSREKMNPGIPLFYEQDFRRSFAPQQWRSWYLPILPDLRISQWFPPLCCMVFSSCSSYALWLFYTLGRELSFPPCLLYDYILHSNNSLVCSSYRIFSGRLLSFGQPNAL